MNHVPGAAQHVSEESRIRPGDSDPRAFAFSSSR